MYKYILFVLLLTSCSEICEFKPELMPKERAYLYGEDLQFWCDDTESTLIRGYIQGQMDTLRATEIISMNCLKGFKDIEIADLVCDHYLSSENPLEDKMPAAIIVHEAIKKHSTCQDTEQ